MPQPSNGGPSSPAGGASGQLNRISSDVLLMEGSTNTNRESSPSPSSSLRAAPLFTDHRTQQSYSVHLQQQASTPKGRRRAKRLLNRLLTKPLRTNFAHDPGDGETCRRKNPSVGGVITTAERWPSSQRANWNAYNPSCCSYTLTEVNKDRGYHAVILPEVKRNAIQCKIDRLKEMDREEQDEWFRSTIPEADPWRKLQKGRSIPAVSDRTMWLEGVTGRSPGPQMRPAIENPPALKYKPPEPWKRTVANYRDENTKLHREGQRKQYLPELAPVSRKVHGGLIAKAGRRLG